MYCSVVLCPASWSAVSYSSLDSLNMVSVLEIVESLDSMAWGILLVTVGGWFDCVWTYCVLLSGFLYGLYSLLAMVNVTSKKSMVFLLAKAVIWSPSCLKMSHSSLFMVSASCGVKSVTARPSSR